MKLIGLDVGTKRIGVAKADTAVRVAVPDGVIIVNGQEFTEIARLSNLYNTTLFVIGMPRNVHGQETAQSAYVREFAKRLKSTIPHARIRFQDETLTSVEAENRLKARKRSYQKGEIDAEAASIILQDFIESFAPPAHLAQNPQAFAQSMTKAFSNEPDLEESVGDILAAEQQELAQAGKKASHHPAKTKKKGSSLVKKLIIIFAVFLVLVAGAWSAAYAWYTENIKAVAAEITCPDVNSESNDTPEVCVYVKFMVKDNESVGQIADNLASAGLIRNSLAFQLNVRLTGHDGELKTGEYSLRKVMSAPEIVDKMVKGAADSNVFNFTILPGETLSSIKQKLIKHGYSETEVESAFLKKYDNPVLSTVPTDGSVPEALRLEGYLFGETYEFYNDATVEEIITRALDEMYKVVEDNNLVTLYNERNLTLHQGITLASIVQKEAKSGDQATVAQVFLTRLKLGLALGSDVTATYAADYLDPERKLYTDNAAILEIDSAYNTRKYNGLPPGPISNPGISALLAVAHPTDTNYLYFLTGDDGKMYYSYTEAEHNQNIVDHCKVLCNVTL